MKSHIVKLSALGLAGALVLQFDNTAILATQKLLTDNGSVAGITVTLNDYAKSATESETTTDVPSFVEASGDAALLGTNAVVADEVKLNLKYDRLGIARVDETLNVRKKATTDSKIIGKMAKNAACNVEKITKDGWAKIKSGDVRGYVKAEYLVLDEEAETLAFKVGKKVATVKTETLNVRFLPSTNSGIYTLVPVDEELEVVREDISEEYVRNFIEKHFSDKKDKELIQDVDLEQMKQELDDWICVSVDDEKVFVSKEYVDLSYTLKRAVSTKTETSKKEGESSQTSIRSSIVAFAMQFLGNSYVYGGTSLTNGTDCSGFTMRIYQHFGYGLPRTAAQQAAATRTISSSEAQPGDLFFYGYSGHVSHVAMYIGGGQVIHASNERTGIKISNAFYRTPVKVGRVISQ